MAMRPRSLVLVTFAAACALAGSCAHRFARAPEPEMHDILVVGTIHTLDPAAPRAEAALVRDGLFACVGTRQECAQKARSGVHVLDLRQGSAVPGLIDAHGHVASLGRSLLEVRC